MKVKKNFLLALAIGLWFVSLVGQISAASCYLNGQCIPIGASENCPSGMTKDSQNDCPTTSDSPTSGSSADEEIGDVSKDTGKRFDFTRELFLNNQGGSENLVQNRYSSVGSIASLIIKYLFMAGGVLLFVLILMSGYKLVFMGDKKKALSSVKQYLTTGVLGFFIMFGAWWIIRIIEVVMNVTITR